MGEDHLETDVHSVSTGMDTIDCHALLQGPSAGVFQIFMPCRMRFSMAFVPQPQVWNLHWLTERLLRSSKILSFWIKSSQIVLYVFLCRSTNFAITGTKG
jgi:hypothetical protein